LTGGAETRPRNLSVIWCIKAWNAPINQGNIDIAALVAALAAISAQAAEDRQGTAKVATQTQADSGTDDTTFITPKKMRWGITASLNANGYIIFPTWMFSFIIQWTTVGSIAAGLSGSVAWPIAFRSACLFGGACAIGSTSSSNSGNIVPGTLSTTGVNLHNWGVITAPSRAWAFGV
jgi:hypothetical protein